MATKRRAAAVAHVLTLSRDTRDKWLDVNDARLDWANMVIADPSHSGGASKAMSKAVESWNAGRELSEKLRFEVAQLDLIARDALRDTASKLLNIHDAVMLLQHPQSERPDWFDTLGEQLERIEGLHKVLVADARADIGVDRRSGTRLRSVWRRYRARWKLARLRARYPKFLIEPSAKPRGYVAIERATRKRAILATTIESMESLLIERQLAHERGESPGLIQGL